MSISNLRVHLRGLRECFEGLFSQSLGNDNGRSESKKEIVSSADAVHIQHFSHNEEIRVLFQLEMIVHFHQIDTAVAHLCKGQVVRLVNGQVEISDIKRFMFVMRIEFRMEDAL